MAMRGITSVPYEIASEWSPARQEAALIAAGECDGMVWDYRQWCWREPPLRK